jgi:uncharacterized protein YjeT (DUF2065 family)
MIQKINMATEKLRRVSGAILVAVGLYLIYYYYITYV